MELLSIDKSVEVFHFIPIPVLQLHYLMQVPWFAFLRTCRYFMLHYIKIPNLIL